MPMVGTIGVTTLDNATISAAIDEGENAAGDTFWLLIKDTQGVVVEEARYSTEPVAIERMAEKLAQRGFGYSGEVWGKHYTLANNSPEP